MIFFNFVFVIYWSSSEIKVKEWVEGGVNELTCAYDQYACHDDRRGIFKGLAFFTYFLRGIFDERGRAYDTRYQNDGVVAQIIERLRGAEFYAGTAEHCSYMRKTLCKSAEIILAREDDKA